MSARPVILSGSLASHECKLGPDGNGNGINPFNIEQRGKAKRGIQWIVCSREKGSKEETGNRSDRRTESAISHYPLSPCIRKTLSFILFLLPPFLRMEVAGYIGLCLLFPIQPNPSIHHHHIPPLPRVPPILYFEGKKREGTMKEERRKRKKDTC